MGSDTKADGDDNKRSMKNKSLEELDEGRPWNDDKDKSNPPRDPSPSYGALDDRDVWKDGPEDDR